jgi:hypothetical protein
VEYRVISTPNGATPRVIHTGPNLDAAIAMFLDNAVTGGDGRTVMEQRRPPGPWEPVTLAEVADTIRAGGWLRYRNGVGG